MLHRNLRIPDLCRPEPRGVLLNAYGMDLLEARAKVVDGIKLLALSFYGSIAKGNWQSLCHANNGGS